LGKSKEGWSGDLFGRTFSKHSSSANLKISAGERRACQV